MVRKHILSTFLLVTLAACNLLFAPHANDPIGVPTTDPQVQIGQAVNQTFEAQTQIALGVQQTMAMVATDTPSDTSSVTLSLTPDKVTVAVSVQTNCRSGPGTAYDVLGIMDVGQTAEVVGRSIYNDNWIIKLPSNPVITCWLWGQYATVVGDTAGLTAYDPPATPTPQASFNVVYSSTGACIFSTYAIFFRITNDGSVTWESNRVIATDLATGETEEYSWDNFPNFDVGCAPVSTDLNLAAGEVGYTSSLAFSTNPAGDWITATIRVCSLDGLAGVCLEKTVTFTP